MEQLDMIMKRAIVHILDSSMPVPVLSDRELETGGDLSGFFKAHIEKFSESDDIKKCVFHDSSPVLEELKKLTNENFIEISKNIARILFSIMNANPDIPPADVAVVLFSSEGTDYLGLLKLNYKTSYTHLTHADELFGNNNEIILQKALLPSSSQKLSEAFLVNLATDEIQLTEKKYEVNGVKENYFSKLFLDCHAPLSQKSKLDIVTRAVEQVNQKYYGAGDVDRTLEVKSTIYKELEEHGALSVETVTDKLFAGQPEMKDDFTERLQKYNMEQEIIEPRTKQTLRKFQKQFLTTESGIEISIPMEQYQNAECVEFITNPDGTISILIKNIEKLTAK